MVKNEYKSKNWEITNKKGNRIISGEHTLDENGNRILTIHFNERTGTSPLTGNIKKFEPLKKSYGPTLNEKEQEEKQEKARQKHRREEKEKIREEVKKILKTK